MDPSPKRDAQCWELAVKVTLCLEIFLVHRLIHDGMKIYNTTLTKDHKKLILGSGSNSTTSYSSYLEAINAAKTAKADRDSKRSKFRSYMETLLTTFNQYARAIDVLIEHHPEITALVWGTMRMMITVSLVRATRIDSSWR